MEATDLAVSLTVQDIQKSLAWYRDVLGCTVAEEHARGGTLASEPADNFGMRTFRPRDPDGFKLTIASERAP